MKRALVIGVGIESAINDASDMKILLEKRDYDTIIMNDKYATHTNIIRAFRWLTRAKYAYFHFSGHSKANALLCYKDTYLSTTDIENNLIFKISKGSKLVICLDCCGVISLPLNESITIISNITNIAYDRVIEGKRRGLLTHSLIGILKRYKYEIEIYDLDIEINAKVMRYNQIVKVMSNNEVLKI